ncbi:MAG: DinB family protein [Acidobacteriota bacterium]|nr:DinB family protein [Acidobacteriota bacterium]
MEIPAISQLENTPEILRLLLSGITEQQTLWNPEPGRWSIAEVLEHMSHTEGHYFRRCIEDIATTDDPELVPYDEKSFAAEGRYSGRNAEDSFDHFEEQRENNISFLNALPVQAPDRTGQHPALGILTIGQILNEWAFHDLGHIRQIAELVRALNYYPAMGAICSQYRIRP